MEGGTEVEDRLKMARMAMKFAIKGVDGVQIHDGSKYEPALDPDGTLSWAAVDEISMLASLAQVIAACMAMLGDVSDAKIDGVEIDLKGVKSAEKKA
jgi:hypothetical protein